MFASSSENLLQTTGLSLKPLLTSPTHSTYVDARLLMYTVHFILLITQSCCSHIRLIAKVCHFCSVLLLFNCLGHYYWRRRDTRWPATTCCHCRQQVFHRHWAYHCHEGLQSPDGNAPHVLTDLCLESRISGLEEAYRGLLYLRPEGSVRAWPWKTASKNHDIS